MTENREDRTDIVNVKENDNIDSDKSFESCVNSVVDGINNVLIKDDDSEKSFLSCSNNIQDKIEACDKKENLEIVSRNKVETEEDDDDDIRPGSCRENPSSEDETSSWDENKDNWIYDTEYLQQTESTVELPKAELTKQDLKLCEKDLEYIIENHVSNNNMKQEMPSKEINNPTFIPTNGKFYMHDLRLEDPKDDQLKKTNKNSKNIQNKSNETWSHDLYDESKQKPISKGELINKYGIDIRQKSDNQEFKENRLKKNQKKRPNYRQRMYYDYEYYDSYDTYHPYYYGNSGYYDYNYYEPQYNSWNRSSRESNRNNIQMKSEYRNYKSNYSPEVKPKKSPKPPNKYSQIAEYTDIQITVNLDNFGTRQIQSISNNSIKKNYNSKTYENSNYRRVDGYTTEENQLEFSESGNCSTQREKSQRESEQNNSIKKTVQETQKRNSFQKSYLDTQKGTNNQSQKGGNNSQTQRRNNYIPTQRNYPEIQRGENNFTQKNYSKSQYRFTDSNHLSEFDKTQGKSQLTNRHKQDVPDWANTKFEWDANCDFKDVIEEMPPLTEKEMNQLPKRPLNSYNPPPPRFSREKSAQQFDGKTQNRVQSFVPKRYSELRNQSEPLQLSQSQPPPTHTLAEPTNQPQIINYQQIIPNLEYYNNIQPLLLNMNQGPHSASANSPQQSSNTFNSIHPQMVSLSPLIPSGGNSSGVGGYDNNQQFYIHPVYLPAASRLNQFSQPFQPSFVSQTSQATVFPTQSPTSSSVNTPKAPQSSRPVLGRS